MLIGLIDNSTGQESSVGRIEVFRNNVWGTVCDDLFGRNDAVAACKQWGSTTPAISWNGNAFYGQGTGPIQIDNANCAANIDSLFLCSVLLHAGDCTHAEDVGVSCPTIRKFVCVHMCMDARLNVYVETETVI